MSRELDAKVAEKVLGLHTNDHSKYWFDVLGTIVYMRDFFEPTTDIKCDYEVLKHVRENWSINDQLRMDKEMAGIISFRSVYGAYLFYQPGDYSKAALKALGETIE